MAVRYRINLVRDRMLKRERERAVLQIASVCLFILAATLIATLAFYIARNRQVSVDTQTIDVLMASMSEKGINADEVADLSARTEDVNARLEIIADVMGSSVSWPLVLADIGQSCKAQKILLRKLACDLRGRHAVLTVEGTSAAVNPIAGMNAFIKALGERDRFGRGRNLTITQDERDGLSFSVEIPLREREAASPPTVKEEPSADER